MGSIIRRPGGGRAPASLVDRQAAGSNQPKDKLFAFPLSPAQERVWHADRREPGDPAYNCAFRWSLRGPLNVGILERAFNEIVRRHEILRAAFSQIGVNPVQLIGPSA